MGEDITEPWEVVLDLDVDSRDSELATPHSPADDAHEVPDTVPLADHRTASITLASILPLFSAGTDESWMQLEFVAEPGLLQLSLALVVRQHRHVYLLEDVLVFAVVAEGILAPSCGPAPSSCEVGVAVRKACRGDVRGLTSSDRSLHPEYGDVVVQGPCVELRVNEQSLDISLLVRVELYVVVHVPLAQTDSEVEGGVRFDAVSGSEDMDVVDECASTDIHTLLRVLLQDGYLPRILTEFRVSIDIDRSLDPAVDSMSIPDSTLSWSVAGCGPSGASTAHLAWAAAP